MDIFRVQKSQIKLLKHLEKGDKKEKKLDLLKAEWKVAQT